MPDEEIGGHDGLAKFVKTTEFNEMNVGFGLDEGLASPNDILDIFHAERNEYWVCPVQSMFLLNMRYFSLRSIALGHLGMGPGLWRTQLLRRPGT